MYEDKGSWQYPFYGKNQKHLKAHQKGNDEIIEHQMTLRSMNDVLGYIISIIYYCAKKSAIYTTSMILLKMCIEHRK